MKHKPINTEAVAKAAGVHPSTITRWAKAGLLPAPETKREGVRGMRVRWAPQAPAQAKWVADRLGEGWSYEEIKTALEAGEFAWTEES
ncbi:MerR family DNA-binding transcriptional regulator [Nannocystis pusilla]|uniref:MerR family DNA-binding transcriptional regulator n=1 Tax=Nannocystis pusilla TaxID=889268 RepID=UPI003DA2A22B